MIEEKEINIEKELYPDAWELRIEDGICYATIVDCDLDAYECTFNNADDVQIDFGKMTHITLDEGSLFALTDLINEAKMYYKNEQS